MRLCLAPDSVQMVMTSPPYYALRDYDHADQIGLEETPEQYVASLIAVFREIRRVLRDDGTVWLVIGDSYCADQKGINGGVESSGLAGGGEYQATTTQPGLRRANANYRQYGLKTKDLIGIPWRVAFALQADGWYLRQEIIWAKPNPMPESVKDRCTKAHESIFLLSKSPRYYFDIDAIAEPSIGAFRNGQKERPKNNAAIPPRHARWGAVHSGLDRTTRGVTRNKRSVWTVASKPYREAHFATFPPDLIEPCILAGSPPQCCGACGAPWLRIVERTAMVIDRSDRTHDLGRTRSSGTNMVPPSSVTIGWRPSCTCNAAPTPPVVLDPFGGAGTTALVAQRLGRSSVSFELNPGYVAMAEARLAADRPA